MPGGKVHGLGGAKGHCSFESPRKLELEERQNKRLARKVEARARALVKRANRAKKIFAWGRAQLKLALAERKSGKIEYWGLLFRQLAINKVVSERLPKQRVLAGSKAIVLKGDARNILGRIRIEGIMEKVRESHRYSKADAKAKIGKWELRLRGTLPKE